MSHSPSHDSLYSGNPPKGLSLEPVIINVCLSGNVTDKSLNCAVPKSIAEITDDACRVIEAGASMLHIHAFDEDEQPTWEPDIFGRIFEAIRQDYPDVILTATTSGRLHNSFEKRSAVLELDGAAKPDMASLTLSSQNFPKQASINEPEMIIKLCEKMRKNNILPELEAFDLGMLNYAFYLQRKSLLPEDCYINLLLGSLGTVPGRVLDMVNLVREIPENWTWAAAGIGRYQLAINTSAIAAGGHVRVGLEDNPFYDYQNRKPAGNSDFVKRLVRICNELERPVATSFETRKTLRIGDRQNWDATQLSIRKMHPEDMTDALAILEQWNMAPHLRKSEDQKLERETIEVENTFVAVRNGKIIGLSSYIIWDDSHAETASLAVDRAYLGSGVGYQLQCARLDELKAKGIRYLQTEADRPDVIYWYLQKFGYEVVGTNPKKHDFGSSQHNEWTILKLDLTKS